MKVRAQLSAGEVELVLNALSDRLAECAISTQPEVAAKVLSLVQKRDTSMAEFSKVVRSDQTLSARMLRLANSAHFAQRQPVTSIDRACVLLGMERLRSLCLGFYISRGAADPSHELSRKVWGQSLFRACLASELATRSGLGLAPEAFVVGLMLDVGTPLMAKLLGDPYKAILDIPETPARKFRREFEELTFTHVDVATALIRYWKLPDLLAKPIERHHQKPMAAAPRDDMNRLHKIAYYVGSLDLDSGGLPVKRTAPMPEIARGVLNLGEAELTEAITLAKAEYGNVYTTFSDVAEALSNLDALAARAHEKLADELEARVLQATTDVPPEQFDFPHGTIEIERAEESTIAYLRDSKGERLVAYRFDPAKESPTALLHHLGIDGASADDVQRLAAHLSRLAA